jgi:hypothetical protein
VELGPELPLIAAQLGLDVIELDNQRPVEKIRSCCAKIRNSVEDQRARGVEHSLVMVAVEFASAKAAAGREPASGVGKSLERWFRLSKHTNDALRAAATRSRTSSGAPLSAEVRGSMSDVTTLHPVDFPAPCSPLATKIG